MLRRIIMNCNSTIENFLKLDNTKALPFLMRMHMPFCPKCREEIRYMQTVFQSLKKSTPFEMQKDLNDVVMQGIRISNNNIYDTSISPFRWLTTGLLIFVGIFFISFSESHIWLQGHFGPSLDLPLYIVLGMIISIYFLIFVGTHLNGMRKTLHYLIKRGYTTALGQINLKNHLSGCIS